MAKYKAEGSQAGANEMRLLYKTRWVIEKVFDETKTKFQEQKSWATSATAKEMPAHFVAIVHHLLLHVQD